MTEPLNRDDIIELLNRLGSKRDEDVLEAARQAHAQLTAAGVTWEDLLVPDRSDEVDDGGGEYLDQEDEDEDDDGDGDGDGDGEYLDQKDEDDEPPAAKAGNDAESRKLIDKLLARKGISDDLRAELNGYKTDIAEGEFTEADRRYLDALHKRLSK
jgi:hypothetical protein